MYFLRLFNAALLVLAVSACGYVPRLVNEYKIDIQQGNVLTQEMVSQLRPGQTKDQVRFILGTPVLQDMFHADRWDYIYRFQKGGAKQAEMRKFSTFFDASGRLVRVSGDVSAAESADILSIPKSKASEIDLGSIGEGSTMPPSEEKGFFGRMMESVGL